MGNPVAFHLTAGQDSDLEGADALMEEMTNAEAVLVDKAYDADERVRQKLQDKGCRTVMPPRKNRLNPSDYDKELYKDRHLIENFFAKLKQYRTITTRYDNTASNFLGAVFVASIIIWLN